MSEPLHLRRVLGRRRLSMMLSVFIRNLLSKGGDNISQKQLDIIELQLRVLILQMDKVLTMIPDSTRVILTRVDTAANGIGAAIAPIAARLDKLVLGLGSMTQEEEDAVKLEISADADKLELAVTALQALGKDPENPVPQESILPTPIV